VNSPRKFLCVAFADFAVSTSCDNDTNDSVGAGVRRRARLGGRHEIRITNYQLHRTSVAAEGRTVLYCITEGINSGVARLFGCQLLPITSDRLFSF